MQTTETSTHYLIGAKMQEQEAYTGSFTQRSLINLLQIGELSIMQPNSTPKNRLKLHYEQREPFMLLVTWL